LLERDQECRRDHADRQDDEQAEDLVVEDLVERVLHQCFGCVSVHRQSVSFADDLLGAATAAGARPLTFTRPMKDSSSVARRWEMVWIEMPAARNRSIVRSSSSGVTCSENDVPSICSPVPIPATISD